MTDIQAIYERLKQVMKEAGFVNPPKIVNHRITIDITEEPLEPPYIDFLDWITEPAAEPETVANILGGEWNPDEGYDQWLNRSFPQNFFNDE